MFFMRYGLGGSFGGCENCEWEECDATTEDEAYKEAWRRACEEYESYEGLYGLRTIEDIMEEEECDEEEAGITYSDEMESWIDYEVVEANSIDEIEGD